jgi:hypothetical protein
MPVPDPGAPFSLELALFATTLSTVVALAFGKKSRLACVAFAWNSPTAITRAARNKTLITAVASQAVSRLKFLICRSPLEHFLVFVVPILSPSSTARFALILFSKSCECFRICQHAWLYMAPPLSVVLRLSLWKIMTIILRSNRHMDRRVQNWTLGRSVVATERSFSKDGHLFPAVDMKDGNPSTFDSFSLPTSTTRRVLGRVVRHGGGAQRGSC